MGDGTRELDEVLDEVYDWICDFIESDHFGRLGAEHQDWAEEILLTFTEYMYSYHGLRPEEWDERQVEVCCLETIPQKLAAAETYYRSIAPVLTVFFRFVGEEELLANGMALSRRIQRLGARIHDNAVDPRCWGASKTFAMAAVRAGVDLTDPAEMDRFLAVYQKKLAVKFTRAAPANQPRDDKAAGGRRVP